MAKIKFLCLFIAILCGLCAPAQAQVNAALPSIVQAEITEAQSSCKPERSVLLPGFIAERDINSDGVKDYILDYGKFECGGSVAGYCGTAGCLVQVFASLPGGKYVKALDENVRSIKFGIIKDRPAITLDLHGSACGKVGAAPCPKILIWNGQNFVPRK
jgi:hypothetical protein